MNELYATRIKKNERLIRFIDDVFSEAILISDFDTASKMSRFKINIQNNRTKCSYYISKKGENYFIGLKLKNEIIFTKAVTANQMRGELFDIFGINI